MRKKINKNSLYSALIGIIIYVILYWTIGYLRYSRPWQFPVNLNTEFTVGNGKVFFSMLRKNMEYAKVRDILNEPFETFDYGFIQVFAYSRPLDKNKKYASRVLVFQNEKLKEWIFKEVNANENPLERVILNVQ